MADTLLLQRSKHTVDSFKELLQARGQDVDDSEKERFFSSSDVCCLSTLHECMRAQSGDEVLLT